MGTCADASGYAGVPTGRTWGQRAYRRGAGGERWRNRPERDWVWRSAQPLMRQSHARRRRIGCAHTWATWTALTLRRASSPATERWPCDDPEREYPSWCPCLLYDDLPAARVLAGRDRCGFRRDPPASTLPDELDRSHRARGATACQCVLLGRQGRPVRRARSSLDRRSSSTTCRGRRVEPRRGGRTSRSWTRGGTARGGCFRAVLADPERPAAGWSTQPPSVRHLTRRRLVTARSLGPRCRAEIAASAPAATSSRSHSSISRLRRGAPRSTKLRWAATYSCLPGVSMRTGSKPSPLSRTATRACRARGCPTPARAVGHQLRRDQGREPESCACRGPSRRAGTPAARNASRSSRPGLESVQRWRRVREERNASKCEQRDPVRLDDRVGAGRPQPQRPVGAGSRPALAGAPSPTRAARSSPGSAYAPPSRPAAAGSTRPAARWEREVVRRDG